MATNRCSSELTTFHFWCNGLAVSSALLHPYRKDQLRAFLAERRVPGIATPVTPLCPCGSGPETPEHLAVHCPELQRERLSLRGVGGQTPTTRRDFAEASRRPETAGALAKWMLRTGRLPEFRLAERLARSDEGPGLDSDSVPESSFSPGPSPEPEPLPYGNPPSLP
jgi:hypothetical protein